MALSACSVNPATGRNQFTGLLPVEQEAQIGAQEHVKIVRQMGLYEDDALQNYVNVIGQRLAVHTERPDVTYRFFIVDSDMVNAFALPGGYIYVTRGLMALANSEAELAAVIAHEIAHVTARHSAERYSQGVLTGLGATILGAAVDNPDASRALGVGADLFTKSYSRDQEHEADALGVRYLAQAGYDPYAMSRFLQHLYHYAQLEEQVSGQRAPPTFLSTHPATQDRFPRAASIATNYGIAEGQQAVVNLDDYLRRINGLSFGSSTREGVISGQDFLHPDIGFAFTAPEGFEIINRTDEVIIRGPRAAVAIFDFDSTDQPIEPLTYITRVWMSGERLEMPERITVNGLNGATAAFFGTVNGQPSTIRMVAVEWQPGTFARFQISIPQGVSPNVVQELQRMTYSFRRLSAEDQRALPSDTLKIVTAKSGDTVAGLAAEQPFGRYNEARFRVLNGLKGNEVLQAGRIYKIIER